MIRGIHSAASGMIAQMVSQETTANNLANANTSGYKRDVPSFGVLLSNITGHAPLSQVVTRSGSDPTQGTLVETGDPLNIAIEGDGFFTVQTANGQAYTRDGAFTLNQDGYLVTMSGNKVLGKAGPIKLSKTDVRIAEDGQVFQGKTKVDTLKIVSFRDINRLEKRGESLWFTAGAISSAAVSSRVRQGYLESSNVNTIREMVSMITAFRTFEASQKAIQAQDETLDKAVNDVGRLG